MQQNSNPRISYLDALNKARQAVATDKMTARMMKTVKKWENERSKARREGKEIRKKMIPLRNALFCAIEDMKRKETCKFETKHANLLEQQKDIRRRIQKANIQSRAATMRLAKKHGFIRR